MDSKPFVPGLSGALVAHSARWCCQSRWQFELSFADFKASIQLIEGSGITLTSFPLLSVVRLYLLLQPAIDFLR